LKEICQLSGSSGTDRGSELFPIKVWKVKLQNRVRNRTQRATLDTHWVYSVLHIERRRMNNKKTENIFSDVTIHTY
jgi:hypothetical protein